MMFRLKRHALPDYNSKPLSTEHAYQSKQGLTRMETVQVICKTDATGSSTVTQTVGNERLLSSDEAADFLRVSRYTLPTWRRLGRSPPYRKLGRRVIYSMTDLEAFVGALPRR